MAITESWLKSYITEAQIAIENYIPLRADRPKRTGGGCLLYIHKSFIISNEFTFCDNYNSLVLCHIETMNTTVAVLYRPPDSSPESFQKLLTAAQKKIDEINKDRRDADLFLLGDFNLPAINWEFLTISPSICRDTKQSCLSLLDFMDRNFLTQTITVPTRKDNILDLVFTNKPEYIIETNASPTGLSDHKLVEVLLNFNPINPPTVINQKIDPLSFRAVNCHRADFIALNEDLSTVNWVKLKSLCENDVDGSKFLELIRLVVLQLTLKHAPAKEKKPGDSKSRRAREEYTMKRKRRKLNAKICTLQKENPTSQILPKMINEVSLLTYDIKEYIMGNMNQKEMKAVDTIKTNPRYFYSYAKRFSKTKSTVSPLRDEHGVLKIKAADKSEILQSQYVKVFSDPAIADVESCIRTLEKNLPKLEETPTIGELLFTETDIVAAIKELDPYSSTSDDDIPARILGACKENLAVPLTLLWYDSYQEGVIPADLKTQYITPVFKKGARTEAANYRPISITSHVIKIFERVIRNHLVKHLEENSLLSDSQHGFRKRRSCLTQLIAHVDQIFQGLTNDEEVDVIYLDYAKAFDKVDHNILLAKLKSYGIDGKTYIWLREFLTKRQQTVVVEGTKSTFEEVRSGVPQGTVLGPILFIVEINDQIEALISSKGSMFADDSKLLMKIIGILCHALLQEDLHNIIAWSALNNMLLNEDKFEVLNYTLNKSQLLANLPFTSIYRQYETSDGKTILPTNITKDLGVYLSNDCSWTPHINQMTQTARQIASWVLSVFRDRSQTVMLTLFKTMVRSKLEYCCPVWDPNAIGDIQTIEHVQRNFTRRISTCKDLNYWERLEKLKLQSLQRRRERYIIIHTWKIMHGLAPNDICMEFHEHQRLGMKIKIPPLNAKAQKSVATKYDNSFGVKAAKLWNIIPKDVKDKTILEHFKVALGNFLSKFPDNPPTKGYSTTNDNSLLSWIKQRSYLQEDAHDAVVQM
jgi:hypothetical protein